MADWKHIARLQLWPFKACAIVYTRESPVRIYGINVGWAPSFQRPPRTVFVCHVYLGVRDWTIGPYRGKW